MFSIIFCCYYLLFLIADVISSISLLLSRLPVDFTLVEYIVNYFQKCFINRLSYTKKKLINLNNLFYLVVIVYLTIVYLILILLSILLIKLILVKHIISYLYKCFMEWLSYINKKVDWLKHLDWFDNNISTSSFYILFYLYWIFRLFIKRYKSLAYSKEINFIWSIII